MAERYVGRHRQADLARAVAASGRSGVSFRPLVRAGATVALASATVGGYLTAGGVSAPGEGVVVADPAPTPASGATLGQLMTLTSEHVSPVALSAFDAVAADGEIAMAQRERVGRAAAAEAAAAAAAEAAAAEAARLEAERKAAAERAARDAQRASVLASAQSNPKAVAAMMVADRGWNESQFGCLVKLWTKESNWNYRATNRSSGAYGIPQSLPGSKMASVAPDWRTNPITQITWGLNYISARYGTPCGAWGHSVSHNWY